MDTLQKREADLLSALAQTEAEADRYRFTLRQLDEQIEAQKNDLNGIREEILELFLQEHMTRLNLAYTIGVTNGEITLNVISIPGHELEFTKFRERLGWVDTTNIPLFYVLNYIGKGMPWAAKEASLYDTR